MLPALTMSTPIHDVHGDCVTTLGGILQKNKDLKHDNTLLVERLDHLAADITAQGGLMLGKHTFTSEVRLLELCMKECPKGNSFAVVEAPMVVFCFDLSYVPLTGWEMLIKAMEMSGSHPIADRKVVPLYKAHYSHWFSEGKMAAANKTLPAFASKEKWQGTGGMDGQRVGIELLLDTSADGV